MVWYDILFNRILSKQEISNSFAMLFNVKKEQISIAKNFETANFGDDIQIICLTYLFNAEYNFMITVHFLNDSLVPTNGIEILQKLCEMLNCSVLIPDENSLAPSAMLKILGKGYDVENINLYDYDKAGEEFDTQE